MTVTHPEQALRDMEARKDAAYLERNQVVAALAKCFPSGVARTAIEGWSEDWHGCVYIDLPTGQASWHFHDSHAHLFADLPPYTKPWDGHDTPEKYRRLAALTPQAPQPEAAEPVAAPVQAVATPDLGPWTASADGRRIDSDDFEHDAALLVRGDFGSDAERSAYAVDIARRLSATPPVSVERDAEYEVHQDHGEWTEFAAGTDGPAELALAEAMHYARQYAADGPVKVFRVARIEVAALAQAGDKEQQT